MDSVFRLGNVELTKIYKILGNIPEVGYLFFFGGIFDPFLNKVSNLGDEPNKYEDVDQVECGVEQGDCEGHDGEGAGCVAFTCFDFNDVFGEVVDKFPYSPG